MNNSSPSVSVVIPALNAAGPIRAALKSVEAQTYQYIVETIVAAGDPETEQAARLLGAIVVGNPSGKTPSALNKAIAAASGEIIVRLDAHAVLPPDYVARAVETMQRTGAVNVGGMQIPVGTTYWERSIAAAMSSPVGAGNARYRTGGTEGEIETVYLGVYDKQAVDRLGGFDEDFVRNQDYELNHRIIRAGGKVWFDPELKVEYTPRGSLKALWSQYYQYGKAKRMFFRRHPGSLRFRQIGPPVLVLGLGACLIGSFFWPVAALVPGAYVLGVAAATYRQPSDSRPFLGTIAAVITMHIAWGVGFLVNLG